MKTSSDHFHVCSTVGIESLPKRCIYQSWSLLYSIKLLILRERNNICEFPCLQSRSFFAQQRPAHTPLPQCSSRWPTFISSEEFLAEKGFISFSKCFFIVFFQILCSVLFFKFSSGRQLAQRRTASAARGATYFMFFSNILVFQRKLLLLQFSIISIRSFNKNTQF